MGYIGRALRGGPGQYWGRCRRRLLGSTESKRWESIAPAPDTGGCDTLVQRAGLLRAPGVARCIPVSTLGRGNGIYGVRKMDAGVMGAQVVGEQAPALALHFEVRPLCTSPLHVGVLQRLLCTKPLVGSKRQELLEEVQGFWGGVWRQEGVQRLPWPAGSRLSSPL